MAEFVDATVKEIDSRLNELKEEVSRLEAARSALLGTRRGPGRPRGSKSSSTRSGSSRASRSSRSGSRRSGSGRGRGRRGGTRSNQALELVRSNPGITIPQIAEGLSIEPNYLYRVMPRLVNDGKIRRDGQGWFPAEAV